MLTQIISNTHLGLKYYLSCKRLKKRKRKKCYSSSQASVEHIEWNQDVMD